ncbi:HAD family hydrolase [Patescibacteria group bacterium]
MNYKAAIFDMNGTILSDEDEYGLAFNKVLKRLGAEVKLDYPHESGIGVEENWTMLLGNYNIKTNKTTQQLAVETQEEYSKLIPKVTLKKGFHSFAQKLSKKGIVMGLATSNTWSVVEKIFKKFDIEKYFQVVTTCEELVKNKPDPEIFIKTAEKLQTERGDCIVFEDSVAGIKGAKTAGMKTVGIARDKKYEGILKEVGADFVIYNYLELIDK